MIGGFLLFAIRSLAASISVGWNRTRGDAISTEGEETSDQARAFLDHTRG